ncbi:MAG: formylglycine-generating enzyme family protein [Bacteroidaceae bacterium]|nr:formylglycine-generating enzyme family protein [Bacteroidaceae bacterium]
MNTISLYSKILRLTMCVTIAVFLFSCGNEDEPVPEVQKEEYTVQMLFSAAPPSYIDSEDGSEAKATRAVTADWPDGARLYLHFSDKKIAGTATYDAGTKQWTLSFSGRLNEDADDRCEVWYFENPVSADATSASFSPTTAIFYADSATYYYHNEIVHLRAVLKPTEVRLRFKGTAGTVVSVADWPRYAKFTSPLAVFAEADGYPFTITVGSDGYTPYIYGHNDIDFMHVEIASTPYYPLFDTDIQPGCSYSTAVPTESLVSAGKWSHNDTHNRIYRSYMVTGNGKRVTFKMTKVDGGTFQMGSKAGDSDEKPVHTVKISKAFYMCDTEVTQALWYAVMGQSPTLKGSQWENTRGLGDEYPAYYISYEDCISFLTALNDKLSEQLNSGEKFRFPTEAEWEFAAKGGNKSTGCIYAGSYTIGNVAWYSNNSGSTTHPVKTKYPNELGLYEMSGNVWEWCYDRYGDYSSGLKTNPTGPTSGSYRVNRGGSWIDGDSFSRVENRAWNMPTTRSNKIGLRLCLGAPIEE